MNSPDGTLIGLVGACGGAGASCLASSLAVALHRAHSEAVLVDLDFAGPGLEVLLGLEREAGARWPDLAAARGEVDGRGLLSALPHWGKLPVLSSTRLAIEPAADEVVLDVCAGLLRAGQSVVLDLPRPGAWTSAIRALLTDADDIVLLAPLTMAGSAGAQAVAAALRTLTPRSGRGPRLHLAVAQGQAGHVGADDLAALVGLDLAVRVRCQRRVAATIEQGLGPDLGRGSSLARAGAQLGNELGARR